MIELIRLGIAQTHPVIGDATHNLEQTARLLATAEEERVDVLVLPELTNSGYAFESREETEAAAETIPTGPFSQLLKKWSRGRSVVGGICERTSGGLYNSAPVFVDGKHVVTYRKVHLFNREKEFFSPGNQEPPVFKFKDATFGVMICWDWIYPEMARILALKGAQVILHPANLVLPYCHNAMITRSIENGIFTATANRIGRERDLSFNGRSQITSNKGEVLVQMDEMETGIRWVDIDPAEADNKRLTDRNDLLKDRRPELYTRLIHSEDHGESGH
ncbi:MAG: acyltransferase [Candidatus Thorarchaeota archaeon]|nr:acyltransferase [Candidatus Thorarchaeota archaeon]